MLWFKNSAIRRRHSDDLLGRDPAAYVFRKRLQDEERS